MDDDSTMMGMSDGLDETEEEVDPDTIGEVGEEGEEKDEEEEEEDFS